MIAKHSTKAAYEAFETPTTTTRALLALISPAFISYLGTD